MATISPAIWGIPPVRSSNERDLLFPTPTVNQRVHNVTTRTIERWDGSAWVRDSFGVAVDVRDYGAIGDGVTDDTAALTNAFTAGAGGAINIPQGYTFISGQLLLASGTHYYGGGCIKCKAGTTIGFGTEGLGAGLLYGENCVGTFVEDIEVDGNGDTASTSCHGIVFHDGEWNTVQRCHVHDTDQAGIGGFNEASFNAIDNEVRDCGRSATNNHGIMFVSTKVDGMTDTVCKLNRVDGTMRKGITSYAASPGFFQGMDVSLNTVTGSGLGNIYLGALPGSYLDGLTCVGNTCRDAPINMELDNVRNSTVGMNTLTDTSNDANIHLYGCTDVLVASNTCVRAAFHGIMLSQGSGAINCLRIKIQGNSIVASNQNANGTGSGIAMENSTYCDLSGNTISDDDGHQKWCILEDAGCDHNTIENNPHLENFLTARVNITGANTRYSASTGLNRGVGTVTPVDPLDIAKATRFQSAVRADPLALILTTGTNNNVAVTAVGKVYVPTTNSGPLSADFTITGIDSTGSSDGREIELFNASTHNMTIKHLSASSSVGNRIAIGGSADLVISSFGAVTLRYFASSYGNPTWAVKGYKA